jgi:hypothetical protein
LQFFFKEAVEYNDILLHDINNLNGKAFQLLAVAIAAFSAAVGFFLSTWGQEGKSSVADARIVACIGLIVVIASLLLAVFPKSIYRGKLTPNIAFEGILYKAPMSKLLADCIASYNGYIASNNKVLKYRSFFLTAGAIGIFAVPLLTVMVFLIGLLS